MIDSSTCVSEWETGREDSTANPKSKSGIGTPQGSTLKETGIWFRLLTHRNRRYAACERCCILKYYEVVEEPWFRLQFFLAFEATCLLTVSAAQVTDETSLQALYRIAEEAKDMARPGMTSVICCRQCGLLWK